MSRTIEKRVPEIVVAMSVIATLISVAPIAAAQDDLPAETSAIVVTPDFAADAWVDGNQPIGLRLSRPLDVRTERLAVIIGHTDVSALFSVTPTVARYTANSLRLPSGETELVAYIVTSGEPWKEVARVPLRVRTRSGFRRSDMKPALTLTTTGQIAPDAERPPYPGVTFNPAFTTKLQNERSTFELQSNFLAVTKQTHALRYGAQGNSAPKFDLSDYLLKGVNGPFSASIGHVSFGNAKHLINGVASRGITAGLALAKIGEVSVGLLNGTSIVGWDNPLGLANVDHRVFGAALKLDPIRSHPEAVVFDVSLLQGQQLPRSGVNDGEINDRERNRGAAFHFASKLPNDRLTLDAGYTVSRFENPVDPTLSQGVDLVPVRRNTKAARYADVSLAILQNASITRLIKASLTATYRHERIDPLYRSLAAAVQANTLQNVFEITGGLGPLAVQASRSRAEDNLDDLPSVLKTFTRVTSVNASVPVGSLFNASRPSPYLPQVTWTLSSTHQFAKDVPTNSDFTETHAPDQMSDNQSVDAQWAMGKWKGGYRYNISDQDNRQPGREKADLGTLAHNVAASYSPWSWADLGGTYSFEGSKNRELRQKNATRRLGANLDIRATRNLTMSTVFSRTWVRDYPLTNDAENDELSVELSDSFRLLRGVAERPSGRLFIRYQRQASVNTPVVRALRQNSVSRDLWSLNSGVSLNAF